MARVEERAGHDSDRVREVDDPGVVRGELADAFRDPEDDGDRPHRLGEPAGACRLLPDAAARQRHGLVREPRLLAADADLDEDEVGAFDSAVEVVRDDELSLETVPLEHARGEAAHDLPAISVDVLQHELAHGKPFALAGEPADELGGVGGAAADDCDLHPFTPVSVTPSTKARCAKKKRRTTGAMTMSVAAIVRFHCTW